MAEEKPTNRPNRDTRMKHLAIALADNAALDIARIKRSSSRKAAKQAGIKLEDMDLGIKMAEWTPTEIAEYFAGKLDFLADMDIDLGTQFDLFNGPKPASRAPADYRAAGLFAGIKGKDASPPADLSDFEVQQWMEGWHEGQKYLGQGMELRLLQSGGGAGPAEPDKVEDAAVPQEVEDLPGSLEEWDDDHHAVFDGWYQTVPADAAPTIVNGAVSSIFNKRREDAAFQAPEAELDKQTGRKAAKAAKAGETT